MTKPKKNIKYVGEEQVVALFMKLETQSKACHTLFEDLKKAYQKTNALEEKFAKAIRKSITFMNKFTENSEKQLEVMEKVVVINSNAEETLCNVLLAIRQNQALQPWYPPQKGEPEKYVVGSLDDNFTWHKERNLRD